MVDVTKRSDIYSRFTVPLPTTLQSELVLFGTISGMGNNLPRLGHLLQVLTELVLLNVIGSSSVAQVTHVLTPLVCYMVVLLG